MPDFIHILLDGSVRGELAGACHIKDSALSPVVFVAVSGFHSLLCFCVGLEVLEDEVGVCLRSALGVQQRIVQRAEQLGISRCEGSVDPVLAKFDNTIMGTIRNAFIMSILQLPKTVVMFVMAFFPLIIYLVSLRLIPIIFLFGFSLPAYASAMLYNKFFRKLEDQLLSEQEPAPEVSPEEDERVFHDEIDESIKIEDK